MHLLCCYSIGAPVIMCTHMCFLANFIRRASCVYLLHFGSELISFHTSTFHTSCNLLLRCQTCAGRRWCFLSSASMRAPTLRHACTKREALLNTCSACQKRNDSDLMRQTCFSVTNYLETEPLVYCKMLNWLELEMFPTSPRVTGRNHLV